MLTIAPAWIRSEIKRFAGIVKSAGVRACHIAVRIRSARWDTDNLRTRFGAEPVEKLNERRIPVDASHAGAKTVMDLASVSRSPVIACHTAARVLSGYARGLPDERFKAITSRGDQIGVVLLPAFIVPPGGEPRGGATTDMVADHVLHILNRIRTCRCSTARPGKSGRTSRPRCCAGGSARPR